MPKLNFWSGLTFGLGLVIAMRLGWPLIQMVVGFSLHLLTPGN